MRLLRHWLDRRRHPARYAQLARLLPALRQFATFQAKLANVAKRGAVGLVIMNDPHSFPATPPGDARPRRGRARA